MYCPKCGSNNQDKIKFCTRCGTNLSVVTNALAGKPTSQSPAEDRAANVIKEYYDGRRDAITGAVLIPAGLLIMGILTFAGMKPIGAFFIVCWMFFWAAMALAGGLGKWLASSSEMKRFGYNATPGALPPVSQATALPPAERPDIAPSPYSTGPVNYPGSVTEQTTRTLDERISHSPVENQPQ
jgi:hypothetical protein